MPAAPTLGGKKEFPKSPIEEVENRRFWRRGEKKRRRFNKRTPGGK